MGRLEDGDDARDGGFDDRSSAQLLFRTDSLGARSLRQDGAPSRAITQGQPGANVCEPREGFQPDHRPDASIQPHGRIESSMIRGVRFTTTLECVCRDAQLTSAMATSVRATPGDRASAELPSRTTRERARQGDTGTTRIRTAARRAWKARQQCPLECASAGTARLSAEAARPFVSIHRASGGSRSKDLGGEPEAHGRTGHRRPETAHDGTDPYSEQGLEVDAHSVTRIERRERQREPGRFEQRGEGTAGGQKAVVTRYG